MELHPVTDIPEIASFREWALCEEVQTAIAEMGITKPTPIQALATQHVLDRKDVIAKAETGTGKTLAFGAGMISKLDADRSTVLGLILCPTRELAQQVHDVMAILGATRGIKTALIVGGDPPQPQVQALQNGAQLVVGTPGRVMDLYNQGFLSFPWTEYVVLDEADEMLEIGFIDDIRKILSYTPEERTTLLFSATFPPALLKLAREHTNDPVEIATAKGVSTVDHIAQNYISVDDKDKWLCLVRMIENSEPDDVFLVFGDRRTDVDQLIRRMERMPFNTKALHGGYDQAARFRVMSAFRTGDVKCLVATDVASRGLDVKHVTHVINYGVPRDVSTYTHRIGRTGRAGAKGNATTLVNHRDGGRWRDLERQMNWAVDAIDMPERGGRKGRGRRDDERGERRPRRGRDEERGERRPREDREERRPRRDRDGEREERKRERRRERSRDKAELKEETTSVWGARSGDSPEKAAASEERPRRRRRSEEGGEKRPRRRRSEEGGEERPRRRRSEGCGEERLRRRRSEDGGEEHPRRRRSEEGGEERPSRRRSEGSGEERPRRRRSEGSGEERPRRRRSEGRDGERREPRREEKPRERKPREEKPREQRPAAADTGGGFGAGLVDEAPAKPERKRSPKPKADPAPPTPEPKPEPPASDGGGFGAGL